MSVSYQQKREITEQHYKSACCRRALLYGVIFAKGRMIDENVEVVLSDMETVDFVSRLILEFFGKKPEVYRQSKGGRCIYMKFISNSAANYISSIVDSQKIVIQKCQSCLSSFLRGVFLASGRVSDPKKQFSLEFTLGDRAHKFKELLENLGLTPLYSARKSGDMVYFRKSEDIEDFFGHAALNRAVFNIIEEKINTTAKISTQRYINCVYNNYSRMVKVSERQLQIISRLNELNLLSSLPDELAETARLRLEYFELPLSALSTKFSPPISKSGLSHRLKRIEELGEALLSKK